MDLVELRDLESLTKTKSLNQDQADMIIRASLAKGKRFQYLVNQTTLILLEKQKVDQAQASTILLRSSERMLLLFLLEDAVKRKIVIKLLALALMMV